MSDRERYKNVWRHMVGRCTDKTHKEYNYYGGRGITVCPQWKESLGNFIKDMAPRPKGLILDRINNDGNYEPSNCRWITYRESNINRRHTIWVTLDGERMCLKDAAKAIGINYYTVNKRINRSGWSVMQALDGRVEA